jgi:methanogenic corrinoid protein MtbC1/DNA-binding XRE family transcriptional regulator
MNRDQSINALEARYLEAVLDGDRVRAAMIVQEGLERGVGPTKLYLDVLIPSQFQIGELWHDGKINVAQEHLATQITLAQMDVLRERMKVRGKLDRRAVVAAVEGEPHALGPRVVADFLYFDGWDAAFLGADLPTADLVEFVRQKGADLVALSVTLADNLPAAADAVRGLRALDRVPRVLVGGAAFRAQPHWAEDCGADAMALDALDAIQTARRLAGLGDEGATLSDYLKAVGARVQSLRKSLDWSQQALAERSGLDRTYISAVEHGKQNITLGAVMKLADALEIPLVQLLTGSNEE